MRRYVIPGIAFAVAVALLALLAFGINNQGENTSLDSQLAHGVRPAPPNYSTALPVLGSPGRESLRNLRGKVVVLNFFASWCGPCVAEAPVLEHVQRVLLHHDGTVLGVTYQDNTDDSEAFVHQHDITYPVVRDVTSNFVHSYGSFGIPETFVIDRRGRVAAIQREPVTSAWLAHVLPRILRERS
jgi:cytochrome c biogenesis protein CcmG/thiol:disulfide interchange protein DsbE